MPVREHSRSTILITLLAAGAAAATAAAVGLKAQDAGPGPQGGAPPSMMQTSPILNAIDVNHDGTITAVELANAPARLKTLDKNGDGKLTRDEAGVPFGGRGGPGPGRREGRGGEESEAPPIPGPTADELLATLLNYDKNKNGKLEKSEVPARLQGMFDRGDADKNGVLDAQELRQLAADQAAAPPAPAERRGGGGGRGPGGPGGPGGGRGGFGPFDPAASALDTDHNGEISAEEITNAAAALKALDKNNDGSITEDEVRPAGGGRGLDARGAAAVMA